jgi:putative hemolysin
MVPRIDVSYVKLDTPLSAVAERMLTEGHTRWPVLDDNVDDLMGIIHFRDVFRTLYQTQGETPVPLGELIRNIPIYPETKPVTDLLEEFKRKKLRMAAVADEHGGFAGIVTIEDLMEEIVGEIHREIRFPGWPEPTDDWAMKTLRRLGFPNVSEVQRHPHPGYSHRLGMFRAKR